jgi:hypothetical protein
VYVHFIGDVTEENIVPGYWDLHKWHAIYLDNQGYNSCASSKHGLKSQKNSEWYHVGVRFPRTGR